MQIEHMRIGMPLFAAMFSPETGTITVYRGAVASLDKDDSTGRSCVVLRWEGPEVETEAGLRTKASGAFTVESDRVSETVLGAIENMYVATMLRLRLYSEAARKSEWLFRFCQLNAGDIPFNVAIPVQGKEGEDSDDLVMERLVQELVDKQMREPIRIPILEIPKEIRDQIPSARGLKRLHDTHGVDHNGLACQCREDCPETCDGKECKCPSCSAVYSDRVCER